MPLNIGVSGLNAAAADLRVTGHNIANVGTTGFKESRAEFGDLFAQSFGGVAQTAIGNGVRLLSTTQQFNQGTIEVTENSLDLAISGNGFFVLGDPNNPAGINAYTRAGEYQLDSDGYVVNSSGMRLQGYGPVNPAESDTVFNGLLGDIRVDNTTSPAKATTAVDAIVNLKSGETAPTVTTFSATDPESYNYSTSVNLYDSQGIAHPATFYFVKGEGLTWTANVGTENAAGEMVDLATPITLTFNADGTLATQTPNTVNFPSEGFGNGAADIAVNVDFTGSTQVGTSYAVNQMNQDGYTSGYLTGVDVDRHGVVTARYSNSRLQVLSQVAMAQFQNPQGLQQQGDNNWIETFDSGDPAYGSAMTGGLGKIESGALESSNVDLAAQLVNLITAQRNFQANAKTISTADAIAQTIINLR